MLRHPPDILITTPESLYLILTRRRARCSASAEAVIVDEIHAVASTKRGAHLALTLERLPRQRHGDASSGSACRHAESARGGRAVHGRADAQHADRRHRRA